MHQFGLFGDCTVSSPKKNAVEPPKPQPRPEVEIAKELIVRFEGANNSVTLKELRRLRNAGEIIFNDGNDYEVMLVDLDGLPTVCWKGPRGQKHVSVEQGMIRFIVAHLLAGKAVRLFGSTRAHHTSVKVIREEAAVQNDRSIAPIELDLRVATKPRFNEIDRGMKIRERIALLLAD